MSGEREDVEYLECNLEKYECMDCGKQFIVGTEMLEGQSPVCPYCGTDVVEKVALTDEYNLQELELGCLSLILQNV